MGIKTLSEEFRENLLKSNLQTPPEVVVGLSDLGGSLYYSAFKEDQGEDGVIHNQTVQDPGNVQDLSYDIRKYYLKGIYKHLQISKKLLLIYQLIKLKQ